MSGKISQYTEALSVANDDFFDVSIDTGGGVYATRKVRKSNLGIGGNFADTDLTVDADRTHDLAGFNIDYDATSGSVISKQFDDIKPTTPVTLEKWYGSADGANYYYAIEGGGGNSSSASGFVTYYNGIRVASLGFYNNTQVLFNLKDKTGGNQIFFEPDGNSFHIPDMVIGKLSLSPAAKLQVVGNGSTSATTTALFENSSGVDAFVIKDDSRSGFYGAPDADFIVTIHGEGTNNAKGSIRTEDSAGVKTFSVDNTGTGYFKKDLRVVNRLAVNTTVGSTWTLDVKGFTSNNAQGAFNFTNSSGDLIMKGINNQDVIVGGSFAIGQTDFPDASAALEIESTTGGVLMPRMTAAQGGAITGVDGLIIYVTTTDATFTSIGFWGYENGAWVKL